MRLCTSHYSLHFIIIVGLLLLLPLYYVFDWLDYRETFFCASYDTIVPIVLSTDVRSIFTLVGDAHLLYPL